MPAIEDVHTQAITHEYLDLLSKRLDELDEKVSRKKLSHRERFVAWVAAIGAVISLISGGFTVYDRTIGQSKREQKQIYSDFEADIAKLQALNAQAQSVYYSKTDGAAKSAQFTSIASQKPVPYASAVAKLAQIKSPVGPMELMVLAGEAANQGDFKRALEYSAKAVKAGGSDYTKSEALRLQAQMRIMLSSGSQITEARKDLSDALALLAHYPEAASANSKATLLGTWIGLEAVAGDCARIPALMRSWIGQVRNSAVPIAQQQVLVQTLSYVLNGQARCEWDTTIVPRQSVTPNPNPATSPPNALLNMGPAGP